MRSHDVDVSTRMSGGVMHGMLTRDGIPVAFGDAIDALADPALADRFNDALAAAPFPAFFWECAPTSARLDAPFRFVLADSPALARVKANPAPFRAYFEGGPGRPAVSVFRNQSRRSLLIAPSPMSPLASGAHLAAFARSAPTGQVRQLWGALRPAVERWFAGGEPRLWLSTSGLGVHWLHIRLDPTPKYYGWEAFRVPPG